MITARSLRLSVFAFGLPAIALLVAAPARAQSPLALSGMSLFSDFDANASGQRVFNGVIGKYGVSLASAGAPTMLHGVGGGVDGGGDARLFRNAGESDGLSLIGAYTVNQFRVAVDIRRNLLEPERRRASTEFGLGYTAALTESLSVGGGPTIGFGEVTPSRGGARPGGADNARSLGLTGAATLSLSENWALTGVLGYRARTDGSREDSFFSVLGLGYRF